MDEKVRTIRVLSSGNGYLYVGIINKDEERGRRQRRRRWKIGVSNDEGCISDERRIKRLVLHSKLVFVSCAAVAWSGRFDGVDVH